MTPAQLDALREYVDAVCDHMAHHVKEPNSRMRRYRAARNALEAAFGIPVPPIDVPPPLAPVDLFAEVPSPNRLPNIL